jgi:hypothetical protein
MFDNSKSRFLLRGVFCGVEKLAIVQKVLPTFLFIHCGAKMVVEIEKRLLWCGFILLNVHFSLKTTIFE